LAQSISPKVKPASKGGKTPAICSSYKNADIPPLTLFCGGDIYGTDQLIFFIFFKVRVIT
tara:strand:+ start:243 stop:422 length:180 start_codon:yes stop_codon:yes gene_type:complete